jgi:hypothetical protein
MQQLRRLHGRARSGLPPQRGDVVTLKILICGGSAPVPDTTSTCQNRDQHTPQPTGYVAWHDWAGRMSRAGNSQKRCPGCGLLAIWIGPNVPVREIVTRLEEL